jgi:hypothetical protein
MIPQEELDNARIVIEALCALAVANYPAPTDISLSINGLNHYGAIKVPCGVLLALIAEQEGGR